MRPSILNPLFASAASINGVGEKALKLLNKMNIAKVVDFLWQIPINIVDRTYSPKLINAQLGKIATIKVKVVEHIPNLKKSSPYRVVCEDETEQIVLSFFRVYENSIIKNLPLGEERIVSGKIERFGNSLQMSHPDYIVKTSEVDKVFRIEPVYPLTAGVSNKMQGAFVQKALLKTPQLPEWLDTHFLKQQKFPTFNQALNLVHNPQTIADTIPTTPARNRLAYDELLANQLTLGIARLKIKKQLGRSICGNGLLHQKVLNALPFELTNAQKKVLQEIEVDQKSNYRMLRLLQGDVGSGKTIVALLSMLNVAECGLQSALMAPTEILAKQHFETIKPICDDIGINIELLTGRNKGRARTQILENLMTGKTDIIIGTHALFQEGVEFRDLAFVVVDEQHRFGVHQRLALSAKGNKADVLVMTATPIPRTLVLTSYGDMEYSKIDELPKGRKPVDTRIMPINKANEIILRLKENIKNGAQAYWVCPLIDESEKIDLAAAQARFEILQKTFGNEVGLVHGRMKAKEKDEVMDNFKSGKIKLLVATTVIEVGVNVPQATIMIIEQAERFGLAQLHQLRGRIKRSSMAANCILLYAMPLGENSRARLDIMKKTEDGFEIAEKDLELRGGGEMLGIKQSGFQEFNLANIDAHKNLLLTAYKDAKIILETDPNLQTKRGENLRILLYLFEKDQDIKNFSA